MLLWLKRLYVQDYRPPSWKTFDKSQQGKHELLLVRASALWKRNSLSLFKTASYLTHDQASKITSYVWVCGQIFEYSSHLYVNIECMHCDPGDWLTDPIYPIYTLINKTVSRTWPSFIYSFHMQRKIYNLKFKLQRKVSMHWQQTS